jgi:hypothetical protein
MTMGRCAPSRAPPTLANHTRPDLDCLYTMVDTPLVLEHSIEADVSPTFAWKFRTDITTWSDPPATFQLDGPFAEGVRGLTLMPRQEPLAWWIRDVRQGRSFAIEMPLDQATLRFEWHLGAPKYGDVPQTSRGRIRREPGRRSREDRAFDGCGREVKPGPNSLQ